MAIRHIRDAFNQEAEGYATCLEAFLRYEDNGQGGQHQIITIKGVKNDGSLFNLSTPAHPMKDDPHHHTRLLAKSLKEDVSDEEGAGVRPVAEGAGEHPPVAGPVSPTGGDAAVGDGRS